MAKLAYHLKTELVKKSPKKGKAARTHKYSTGQSVTHGKRGKK
jgi:hypothetical protein